MASAWRAAKACPRSDVPAWRMTGRPWGDGVALSGPRERYQVPTKSSVLTLAGAAKVLVCGSMTTASGAQAAQDFPESVGRSAHRRVQRAVIQGKSHGGEQ